MKNALTAVTVQVAALAWVIALIVDSAPWTTASSLLIGVGLLAMSTVSVVGMIVVGGRWAHRLGLASLSIGLVIALFRPLDWAWWLAVGTSALGLVALLSPGLTASIRKLPAASGPPPRAIAPALLLLAAPALLGLIGNNAAPWALLTVGLTAPNAALLYTRVLPGGLLMVRLLWPLLALAVSPFLGWVAGAGAILFAVAVAVLAWGRAVKASYHPPQETGSTFPIPPELAPGHVLDAAEVDDRGRQR